MCVAKCVKTAPRDPQRVQDRPQVIFHDFVGRRWPAISCYKKEGRHGGLPGDLIVLEHGEQRDRPAHSELAASLLAVWIFPYHAVRRMWSTDRSKSMSPH